MEKKNNEFGPHLIHILKEMCKRVGADYDKINFKEDSWYSKYEWDIEEEEKFIKWLIDYLHNTYGARKELLYYNGKNKKIIVKAVRDFTFNYGWKYKKEE